MQVEPSRHPMSIRGRECHRCSNSNRISVREIGTRRQGCDESPGWIWPASPLLEAFLLSNLHRLLVVSVGRRSASASGIRGREGAAEQGDGCEDSHQSRTDLSLSVTATERTGFSVAAYPPTATLPSGDPDEHCPRCHGQDLLWWNHLRILELGSGTGWLALRLASRGASVTATDRPGAVPLLLQNVVKNQEAFARMQEANDDSNNKDRNCSAEHTVLELMVHVEPLEWGQENETAFAETVDDDQNSDMGWDVIVACEVLYLHESHQPLLRTLLAQCSLRSRFLQRRSVATAAGAAGANPKYANHLQPTLVVVAWEERHPAEEAHFLELANESGFVMVGDSDSDSDCDPNASMRPHVLGASEATSNRIWVTTMSLRS